MLFAVYITTYNRLTYIPIALGYHTPSSLVLLFAFLLALCKTDNSDLVGLWYNHIIVIKYVQ